MTVAQAEVAGILEPAYKVAGDSFDYALNDDILYLAVIDAMGHGRRADIGLAVIYSFMDRAIAEQFGPDHFVIAQITVLDIATGQLLGQRGPSGSAADP